MSRIRQWLSRALHGRRLAAIRRDSAAWHEVDARRYESHADEMLVALNLLPVGDPMRLALHLGRASLLLKADAARWRAGGDHDAAAETMVWAEWYSAEHMRQVEHTSRRICRGKAVAA